MFLNQISKVEPLRTLSIWISEINQMLSNGQVGRETACTAYLSVSLWYQWSVRPQLVKSVQLQKLSWEISIYLMENEEDTTCIHCKAQCWLENGENTCEKIRKASRKGCVGLEGFFLRLLILDDIKENQRNDKSSRSSIARGSPMPERDFTPRRER